MEMRDEARFKYYSIAYFELWQNYVKFSELNLKCEEVIVKIEVK